jgi:hypothetical protein
MKLLVRFLLLWAICITITATGCDSATQAKKKEPSSRKELPKLLQAFSDFEFVGSINIKDDIETTPHDVSSKGFPSYFEPNMKYIFHHRRLNDDEGHLFNILQDRLKTNGVTILEAKVGTYRFIGGADFFISFEEGNTKGTIHTILDWQIMKTPALYEQWDPDDYVITLKPVEPSKDQH